MRRVFWVGAVLIVVFASGNTRLSGETLEDTLQAAQVPTQRFLASELRGKITSYAVLKGEPFLLAYYVDDGSGVLHPPLHVIRYDRAVKDLRRADLRSATALFHGEIPMNCLGSALDIREHRGTIYIDTHDNPSAGCVLILSSSLEFKAALSGWLLGFLGADYAILRRSEIHFMSVHPMHIAIFNIARNQSAEIYPYQDDRQRRHFSRLLAPRISGKWCMEFNAQCDPDNFNTDLVGGVVVNETARVIGFRAKFDPFGFGPSAEKQVLPRTVAYIFRERSGAWEHREFEEHQLQRMLGSMTFDQLISNNPDLAFRPSSEK